MGKKKEGGIKMTSPLVTLVCVVSLFGKVIIPRVSRVG
jgi:hypothetical protein